MPRLDLPLPWSMPFHMLRIWLLPVFLHWALLLGLLLASSAGTAAVVQLRDAQAQVSQGGSSERYPVQLPYRWDALNATAQGTAEFELAFDLEQTHSEAFAVYLARSGNAYEVWLNGQLLARSGDLEQFNGSDFAKKPQLFTVPSGLLGAQNLFRIHIRADAGRRAGLSAVLIGPEREVRPMYEAAYAQQVTSAQVVAMVCFFTALLAAALWVLQPRSAWAAAMPNLPTAPNPPNPPNPLGQHLYGWATLSLLGWVLRVLSESIESPPLLWPWWGFVVAAADGCNMACLVVFCQRLLGSPFPAVGAPAVGLAAACVVFETGSAVLAYFLKIPMLWQASIAAIKLGFVLYALYFIWAAWRSRWRAAKLFALAMAASVLLVVAGRVYSHVLGELYGNAAFTRYASFLFCAALAALVVQRFRSMRMQASALAQSLRSQIAAKESQLAASFVQIEQAARAQARSSERSRILRDMHDGVGAHLATAIGQLQMPSAALQSKNTVGNVDANANADADADRTAALLPILQESLDHLKLSVDALDLPAGDLAALLAALRYRLEPRLRAAGIELLWDVDKLPLLPSMQRPAMQQLQFVVYELLSNAMQHAKAKQVMVHARCGAMLTLTLSDNGQGLPAGFDWNTPQRTGQGLRSMGARAQAIGALWQVHASGSSLASGCALQGACVQLTWQVL